MLVPELGLSNTRRNRQWLALVRLLGEQMVQERAEKLAWKVIETMETTR